MRKFYVGDSKIAGRGLFAKRNIKKGEIVFIMKGEKVVMNGKNGQKILETPNIMGVGKNEWIDPTEPYVFVNHSCEPNMSVKGRVTFVAIKDIKRDEELTFDYSISEDSCWQLKCNCSSKNCRKIVRGLRHLPLSCFKKYQPVFPSYFKKVYISLKS
jgi:uncharacterized protein